MFCTQCGHKLKDGAKFCTKCGAPVQPLDEDDTSSSRGQEDSQGLSETPQQDDQKDAVADGAPTDAVEDADAGSEDAQEGMAAGDSSGGDDSSTASDGAATETLPSTSEASETPEHVETADETMRIPVVAPESNQPSEQQNSNWSSEQQRTERIGFVAQDEEQQPAPKPKSKRPALIAGIVVLVVVLVVGATIGVMYTMGLGPFATSTENTENVTLGSEAMQGLDDGTDDNEDEQDETTDEVDDADAAVSVSVPNVVGLSEEDATSQLESLGLVVGDVVEDYSSSTDAGDVISQSPAGGSSAESGDEVTLMVSKGEKEHQVEHRYTLVQRAMTWDEAEAYCEQQGGYLATITSASEMNEVLAQIPSEGVIMCWLGGYRSGSSWAWNTGESFSVSYWASGEPNNEDGNENRLAMLKVDGAWAWYDVPNDVSDVYNNAKMAFIMEQEVEVD